MYYVLYEFDDYLTHAMAILKCVYLSKKTLDYNGLWISSFRISNNMLYNKTFGKYNFISFLVIQSNVLALAILQQIISKGVEYTRHSQ